jgi:hypothetical protein
MQRGGDCIDLFVVPTIQRADSDYAAEHTWVDQFSRNRFWRVLLASDASQGFECRQSAEGGNMRSLMQPVAVAVLVAIWHFCTVPPANAQAQLPGIQAPQVPNISDQKLDAVAIALVIVTRLRQDYQEQIAGAAPSERERIADEGNSALDKAVTDQGLSVEEFNTIIVVAQNDPNVREKILQRLRSPE